MKPKLVRIPTRQKTNCDELLKELVELLAAQQEALKMTQKIVRALLEEHETQKSPRREPGARSKGTREIQGIVRL